MTASEQQPVPTTYVPKPEGLHLEFHRLAVTGQLHLQRCDDCSRWRHPPRWLCPVCRSPQWSFQPVGGGGKLYSMVVTHFPFDKAWSQAGPYSTAVVELDEGPRLVGAMRSIDGIEVEPGMAVRVVPEHRTDDFAFLWVEPAGR